MFRSHPSASSGLGSKLWATQLCHPDRAYTKVTPDQTYSKVTPDQTYSKVILSLSKETLLHFHELALRLFGYAQDRLVKPPSTPSGPTE